MKRLLTAALLALSSSVFAATLNPIQLLNPVGSTAGQAIVSTGASTAPVWGTVTAGALSPQAANTVVANVTGSSASPTAVSVPNCSGTSSALTYIAGSGFNCNATINAVTLGGATFAAPGPIGSVSTNSGAFSSISTPSATIGGGTINNTTIGATSAAAATFTSMTTPSATIAGGSIANVTLSGASITNSPISGAAGSFTALGATGLISPTSTIGIKGTVTNDNPQAGSVGEYTTQSTSTTSMTTGTATACATLTSLPVGDYDVSGVVTFTPAAGTTPTVLTAGINTTTAVSTGPNGLFQQIVATFSIAQPQLIATPVVRESLAAGTNIILVGQSTFSGGTMTCNGFMRARRIR